MGLLYKAQMQTESKIKRPYRVSGHGLLNGKCISCHCVMHFYTLKPFLKCTMNRGENGRNTMNFMTGWTPNWVGSP